KRFLYGVAGSGCCRTFLEIARALGRAQVPDVEPHEPVDAAAERGIDPEVEKTHARGLAEVDVLAIQRRQLRIERIESRAKASETFVGRATRPLRFGRDRDLARDDKRITRARERIRIAEVVTVVMRDPFARGTRQGGGEAHGSEQITDVGTRAQVRTDALPER